MSLGLIATIASSEPSKSLPSRASSSRTCATYGQWRQMNMTSTALREEKSDRLTFLPVVTSGSSNSGAFVPRASIVEGTAMPTLSRTHPPSVPPGGTDRVNDRDDPAPAHDPN